MWAIHTLEMGVTLGKYVYPIGNTYNSLSDVSPWQFWVPDSRYYWRCI